MKGFLVLETGEIYPGVWVGGSNRAGEIVFNTSFAGYEEIATDPSYYHQIVIMTSPMQGNYGVHQDVWESRRIWIEGFVCLEIQNSLRDKSWKERLLENRAPILSEVDTREIVLRLRKGTPWGALVKADSEEEARVLAKTLIQAGQEAPKDWVYATSRTDGEVRRGDNLVGPKIAVLDFGAKENILRELESRCSELKIFNSRCSAEDILNYRPDGLMLTNGPGDPSDVQVAIDTVRALIGKLPIFGICMGHQILALALGAKTYKLKFGHRGSNHPVRDDLLGQIYVTSQNHGYGVEESSLPQDIKVTHTNLNDGTVAGFYGDKLRVLGIQYHPESCPGPHEGSQLFSFFIERMI